LPVHVAASVLLVDAYSNQYTTMNYTDANISMARQPETENKYTVQKLASVQPKYDSCP